MSAVTELVGLLENKVEELLPTYKQSPFVYNTELNARPDEKNYGVRVGRASSTVGNNNYITLDQNFEIDLTHKYLPKKSSGDLDLRDKIGILSGEIETLYKKLYRRPGAIASGVLMLIAPVDISDPSIDNDNNLVTITLTLSVKYRVATN